MVKTCLAYGCNEKLTKENTDITFYNLPKDKERLRKWLTVLNQRKLEVKPFHVICSKHFKPSDFTIDSNERRILKPNAVPSVFTKRFGLNKGAVKRIFQRHKVSKLQTIKSGDNSGDLTQSVTSNNSYHLRDRKKVRERKVNDHTYSTLKPEQTGSSRYSVADKSKSDHTYSIKRNLETSLLTDHTYTRNQLDNKIINTDGAVVPGGNTIRHDEHNYSLNSLKKSGKNINTKKSSVDVKPKESDINPVMEKQHIDHTYMSSNNYFVNTLNFQNESEQLNNSSINSNNEKLKNYAIENIEPVTLDLRDHTYSKSNRKSRTPRNCNDTNKNIWKKTKILNTNNPINNRFSTTKHRNDDVPTIEIYSNKKSNNVLIKKRRTKSSNIDCVSENNIAVQTQLTNDDRDNENKCDTEMNKSTVLKQTIYSNSINKSDIILNPVIKEEYSPPDEKKTVLTPNNIANLIKEIEDNQKLEENIKNGFVSRKLRSADRLSSHKNKLRKTSIDSITTPSTDCVFLTQIGQDTISTAEYNKVKQDLFLLEPLSTNKDTTTKNRRINSSSDDAQYFAPKSYRPVYVLIDKKFLLEDKKETRAQVNMEKANKLFEEVFGRKIDLDKINNTELDPTCFENELCCRKEYMDELLRRCATRRRFSQPRYVTDFTVADMMCAKTAQRYYELTSTRMDSQKFLIKKLRRQNTQLSQRFKKLSQEIIKMKKLNKSKKTPSIKSGEFDDPVMSS